MIDTGTTAAGRKYINPDSVVDITRNGTTFTMTKVNGSTDTFDQAPVTITLNGSSVTNPSFYAPITAGTAGQVLKSNGSGAPTWADDSYTLPTASSSTLGGVKIGAGIGISSGIISNSGVRNVSTGSSNGTITVNTNGISRSVAVKGLGSNAYTSTAYLPLTGGTLSGNFGVLSTSSESIIAVYNSVNNKSFYLYANENYTGIFYADQNTSKSIISVDTDETIFTGSLNGTAEWARSLSREDYAFLPGYNASTSLTAYKNGVHVWALERDGTNNQMTTHFYDTSGAWTE